MQSYAIGKESLLCYLGFKCATKFFIYDSINGFCQIEFGILLVSQKHALLNRMNTIAHVSTQTDKQKFEFDSLQI